jgi:hypothetical protein
MGLQYPYSGGNKVVFAHLNILHGTMAISFAARALAGRFAEFRTRRQGGSGGVDPFLALYAKDGIIESPLIPHLMGRKKLIWEYLV